MIKKRQKRLVVRTIVLLLLVSAVIYTIFTKDNSKALAVGDSAPDFELTDLDGVTHRLSDYRGEGVFLNFWGTWCPPCKEEMPYIEELYEEFEEKGVRTITISLKDTALSVKNFQNDNKLTFPIARDTTEAVKEAYKFIPLPTTFLINKDGKIEKIISQGMTKDEIRSYMTSIQP
ncbi:thiol-disulfide oxidoreductase ResA [Sporosarcina sp. CAU 1771]